MRVDKWITEAVFGLYVVPGVSVQFNNVRQGEDSTGHMIFKEPNQGPTSEVTFTYS